METVLAYAQIESAAVAPLAVLLLLLLVLLLLLLLLLLLHFSSFIHRFIWEPPLLHTQITEATRYMMTQEMFDQVQNKTKMNNISWPSR